MRGSEAADNEGRRPRIIADNLDPPIDLDVPISLPASSKYLP